MKRPYLRWSLAPGLVLAVWGLSVVSGPRAAPVPVPETRTVRFQRSWVGLEIAPAQIVGQKDIAENACGPAAVFHALRFGNQRLQAVATALPGRNGAAKVQALIDDHGKKPSRDYAAGLRWRTDGVSARDLTDLYNDVLQANQLAKAEGLFLNRQPDEKPELFLRRIHGRLVQSLEQGVPVVVLLRSFAAQPNAAKNAGKDAGADAFLWHGLSGHFVAITKTPAALSEHQRGFAFEFVDSWSGKPEEGYIRVETTRPFAAAKGNAEQWEWLKDCPFLLVTVPSLPLSTGRQPWWARTTVVLNYGIFGPERGKP